MININDDNNNNNNRNNNHIQLPDTKGTVSITNPGRHHDTILRITIIRVYCRALVRGTVRIEVRSRRRADTECEQTEQHFHLK
jgi:hypothetical protein